MASENGWEPSHAGADILEWILVPDTNVHLQVMKGWPSAVMKAYAADYNAFVEPLRDSDSASFTPTNSVATSNHLNGTAMDLNWDSHPFRVSNAGYSPQMIATMREILAFYTYKGVQVMWWAQDWDSPKDAMHHQMGYDTWNNPVTGEFIARFIRADGFSTFRRGGTPEPSSTAADVLARATGISFAKASTVLPLVSFALVKGNCNNPRRIAAALAQWVVESGHFVYTEEIADGPESEERWKYKGRTWIQLTWLENYSGFSKWCYNLGLVPTPDYFVVRPHELADQKWAALGPAYWWAIKYPRINEYADRGDIDNVSKWVNAPAWVDNPSKHANGEQARRDAYNQALALGDQLLTLTSPVQGDDDLSAEDSAKLDRILAYLTGARASKSPFRPLSQKEPVIGDLGAFVEWTDGSVHSLAVQRAAALGEPDSTALLRSIADGDPGQYPDRADDIKLAQKVLNTVAADKLKAAATAAPGGVVNVSQGVSPADVAQIANAAANAVTAKQVATAPAAPLDATTGQLIGAAFDTLEALKGAQSTLSPQAKATVDALIGVLQSETGVSA